MVTALLLASVGVSAPAWFRADPLDLPYLGDSPVGESVLGYVQPVGFEEEGRVQRLQVGPEIRQIQFKAPYHLKDASLRYCLFQGFDGIALYSVNTGAVVYSDEFFASSRRPLSKNGDWVGYRRVNKVPVPSLNGRPLKLPDGCRMISPGDDLLPEQGISSSPTISPSGAFVAGSVLAPDSYSGWRPSAVIWSGEEHEPRELPRPAKIYWAATGEAVNDRGEVAGTLRYHPGRPQNDRLGVAVVWKKDETIILPPTPLEPLKRDDRVQKGGQMTPIFLTEDGIVVGQTLQTFFSTEFGYWISNGTATHWLEDVVEGGGFLGATTVRLAADGRALIALLNADRKGNRQSGWYRLTPITRSDEPSSN